MWADVLDVIKVALGFAATCIVWLWAAIVASWTFVVANAPMLFDGVGGALAIMALTSLVSYLNNKRKQRKLAKVQAAPTSNLTPAATPALSFVAPQRKIITPTDEERRRYDPKLKKLESKIRMGQSFGGDDFLYCRLDLNVSEPKKPPFTLWAFWSLVALCTGISFIVRHFL